MRFFSVLRPNGWPAAYFDDHEAAEQYAAEIGGTVQAAPGLALPDSPVDYYGPTRG